MCDIRKAGQAILKEHLNGIEASNRDEGLDINIESTLRELGLEELINV